MKRRSIFLKMTALMLAFLLLAAGCGRTGGSASGRTAKDPSDAGNTSQSSLSEEESAAEETGESTGEEAAERTQAEPVRVVEGIEYGPTIFGTRMVSF